MQQWTYKQFLAFMKRQWKPGEHIGIEGPTGSGKTFAVRDLLAMRDHIIVIATKAKDGELEKYTKHAGGTFIKRDSWPPEFNETHILLWKKPRYLGDFQTQAQLVYLVLDDVYRHGGWTVYFDDLSFVINALGLKKAMQMMYTQVRSQHVSLLASMQRPQWVILEAQNQSTYILMFKIHDEGDVDRIAEGIGINKRKLKAANAALGKYEFLLLRQGEEPIHVSRAERSN